jgi:hypothetical protein
MDRIKSTPAPVTQGPGSIIISVRTAVSLFVGPARQDRYASAFLWVHLTIPHFPRRPHRSGRNRVTHGRRNSAMSRIGRPNRHHLDASPREPKRVATKVLAQAAVSAFGAQSGRDERSGKCPLSESESRHQVRRPRRPLVTEADVDPSLASPRYALMAWAESTNLGQFLDGRTGGKTAGGSPGGGCRRL